MSQEVLMQLPLPLPHTFPMLLCCPGRFHHLLFAVFSTEKAGFMFSIELRILSPFLQVDKLCSG